VVLCVCGGLFVLEFYFLEIFYSGIHTFLEIMPSLVVEDEN
jgi:hypothetical protein